MKTFTREVLENDDMKNMVLVKFSSDINASNKNGLTFVQTNIISKNTQLLTVIQNGPGSRMSISPLLHHNSVPIANVWHMYYELMKNGFWDYDTLYFQYTSFSRGFVWQLKLVPMNLLGCHCFQILILQSVNEHFSYPGLHTSKM